MNFPDRNPQTFHHYSSSSTTVVSRLQSHLFLNVDEIGTTTRELFRQPTSTVQIKKIFKLQIIEKPLSGKEIAETKNRIGQALC